MLWAILRQLLAGGYSNTSTGQDLGQFDLGPLEQLR